MPDADPYLLHWQCDYSQVYAEAEKFFHGDLVIFLSFLSGITFLIDASLCFYSDTCALSRARCSLFMGSLHAPN